MATGRWAIPTLPGTSIINVKVVEASDSYAAILSSGGVCCCCCWTDLLIQAASGRSRALGVWVVLKRSRASRAGGGEGPGAFDGLRDREAVVDVCQRVQPESLVEVFVVVPGDELGDENAGGDQAAESSGKGRGVFRPLRPGLGEGVVVGDLRPRVRPHHCQITELEGTDPLHEGESAPVRIHRSPARPPRRVGATHLAVGRPSGGALRPQE